MSKATTPLARLAAATLTIEQVRNVDRVAIEQFGMNSLVLMENAALGVVNWVAKRFEERFEFPPRVALLCGTGNNGGDGLAIARHLWVAGWECTVVFSGDVARLSPDANNNFEVLVHGDQACDVRWPNSASEIRSALEGKHLILDCLLGTGASGAPRAPMDEMIRAANRSSACRIAIDIPTGVDSESGVRAEVAFECEATLTFVARKPAMALSNCRMNFGEVHVLPIGIPRALIEQVLAW
ncbi:MAG: NAD(P)H-hydrate epimerase [Aureliella sp.]